MKIYDISRTAQSAPLYPGDSPIVIQTQPAGADGARTSLITAGSHAGTHADAFSHYLPGGAAIDEMPLERYCGPCTVLTVPAAELVKLDDIRGRLDGAERLALRTGGKSYLCEEAAEYLAACGLKALVTDSVSVGPQNNEASVHAILMEAGVAIIENAVLDGVPDGRYLLFAFPVKLGGCDGAPVRAVLVGSGEREAPSAQDFSAPTAPVLDIPAQGE